MSSYSDYSAGRKNRTETDLGGNDERGVTRFVRKDLVVQFSMIDKTIIETVKQTLYGGVAQLGEHLPCKQGVMGSIPIISTSPQSGRPKSGNREGKKVIRISALE